MCVWPEQAGSADDLADDLDQLGRVERLHEPARGAGGAPGLLHLVGALGGQDEDRRALELGVFTQLLRQADAVHAGHVLVGQHEVEVATVGLLEGILSVHGLDDVEACVLQREGDHLAHGSAIVYNKDRVHAVLQQIPNTTAGQE